MADFNVRELPMVTVEEPKKVTAVMSRKDVTRAYHDEMDRLKKPAAHEK